MVTKLSNVWLVGAMSVGCHLGKEKSNLIEEANTKKMCEQAAKDNVLYAKDQ